MVFQKTIKIVFEFSSIVSDVILLLLFLLNLLIFRFFILKLLFFLNSQGSLEFEIILCFFIVINLSLFLLLLLFLWLLFSFLWLFVLVYIVLLLFLGLFFNLAFLWHGFLSCLCLLGQTIFSKYNHIFIFLFFGNTSQWIGSLVQLSNLLRSHLFFNLWYLLICLNFWLILQWRVALLRHLLRILSLSETWEVSISIIVVLSGCFTQI